MSPHQHRVWATIIEVDATYEHTGAGPMDTQSLRFGVSREKVRGYFGVGFAGRQGVDRQILFVLG